MWKEKCVDVLSWPQNNQFKPPSLSRTTRSIFSLDKCCANPDLLSLVAVFATVAIFGNLPPKHSSGETQAEFFIEGLLERLVTCPDAVARKLLEGAVFHIVPNMCPGARKELEYRNRPPCTPHP